MNTARLRNPSHTKASRQVPDRETRVTLAVTKSLRADNQGLSATTPSYQQTLEARGKNPSKDEENTSSLDNQTVGTAKRKPPGQGKESSPRKEGRNPDRTAAYQPKSGQTPKAETQARNNRRRGRDIRPRRQNGATETPPELHTQEQQEVPQTCDQPTHCKSR